MGPLKRQLLGTNRAAGGRVGTSLRACAAATAPMARRIRAWTATAAVCLIPGPVIPAVQEWFGNG
jgi:hypothetical protein